MNITAAYDQVTGAIRVKNISSSRMDNGLVIFLEKYFSLALLVFGTLGNLLCLAVLSRKTFRRSSAGIYLRFLTLSDLAAIYTGVLYFTARSLFDTNFRKTNELSCKFHRWLSFTACDLSSWALVLMSSARLISIAWPMKRMITRLRVYISIVITIILMLAANLPIFIIYGNVTDPITNRTRLCVFTDTSYERFYNHVFSWLVLFKFSFLPGVLLIVLNTALVLSVSRSGKAVGNEKSSSDGSSVLTVSKIKLRLSKWKEKMVGYHSQECTHDVVSVKSDTTTLSEISEASSFGDNGRSPVNKANVTRGGVWSDCICHLKFRGKSQLQQDCPNSEDGLEDFPCDLVMMDAREANVSKEGDVARKVDIGKEHQRDSVPGRQTGIETEKQQDIDTERHDNNGKEFQTNIDRDIISHTTNFSTPLCCSCKASSDDSNNDSHHSNSAEHSVVITAVNTSLTCCQLQALSCNCVCHNNMHQQQEQTATANKDARDTTSPERKSSLTSGDCPNMCLKLDKNTSVNNENNIAYNTPQVCIASSETQQKLDPGHGSNYSTSFDVNNDDTVNKTCNDQDVKGRTFSAKHSDEKSDIKTHESDVDRMKYSDDKAPQPDTAAHTRDNKSSNSFSLNSSDFSHEQGVDHHKHHRVLNSTTSLSEVPPPIMLMDTADTEEKSAVPMTCQDLEHDRASRECSCKQNSDLKRRSMYKGRKSITGQSASKFNKNRSLTRTMLVLNTVFLLCTTPITIYLTGKPYIWPDTDQYSSTQDVFATIANFSMYTNNSINFILYCVTGSRFRVQLVLMFKDLYHFLRNLTRRLLDVCRKNN
uniref:G-protein coupled receptors family 1 profile domain-containing protein n=2 Tax=Arion vulgaris TaxID=1028688 RepID=A0A0B7AV82_9EUPU